VYILIFLVCVVWIREGSNMEMFGRTKRLTGSCLGFLNRKVNKHNFELADISNRLMLQSYRETVFYLTRNTFRETHT
jgi:hypothetical protein